MWHVDSYIVSSVIDDIDTEYGKIAKMIITLGKNHKYLGMTIDYYSPGKVKFSIFNSIGKIVDYNLEEMKCESPTPAAHHLSDIAEDVTKLSRTDAELLHHFVLQLLYLSN